VNKGWYLSKSSRAATFYASLLLISLCLFVTDIALAGDSTGSKAEIEHGTKTPEIESEVRV
jgi:hypothetical protein